MRRKEPTDHSPRILAALVGALLLAAVASATAQTVGITVNSGAIRLTPASLPFVEGRTLEDLRLGKSVRLDFEFSLLAGPRGPVLVQVLESFSLSFDLWEERFAAVKLGPPRRAVSQLSARAIEAWCLDQLVIPRNRLPASVPGARYWIRARYTTPEPQSEGADQTPSVFTLRSVIEALSRRRADAGSQRTVESGTIQLPD